METVHEIQYTKPTTSVITETIAGITYEKPAVTLLHASPLVNAELAGRVCYDSFKNSEHEQVRNFTGEAIEDIEHSDLLDSLCHVYHHMSIAEHANLTYLIKGMSRGALQEQARHRIQGISVRSTRYTMSSIINAFVASRESIQPIQFFTAQLKNLNLFVIVDDNYINIEIETIYNKLRSQQKALGYYEFDQIAVAKSSIELVKTISDPHDLFNALQAGKKKRNVGDAFKHIITDNFKTDLVVTFNLRSLKNYFTLRDSGAAYFGIQWVAEAMKAATPSKYLDLIVKG